MYETPERLKNKNYERKKDNISEDYLEHKNGYLGKILVTAGGALAFIATDLYFHIKEVSPAIYEGSRTIPAQYLSADHGIPWIGIAFTISGVASLGLMALGLKRILRDNEDSEGNGNTDESKETKE
ncbi:membrane protein [Candidatus Mancarchaeum acidiphilum]|uniref:Membrane protein n=1 Tax=Candidatus Mancarchaeum acidiphilum TaxID=1920749 RepID=A0A218NND4_9ARCH|nr:hypothetical protein [Candidatus Mancarchaeum acidiphilum]ASI13954.1 membrane protein [Candidatus Mancarchaeum acidiphilum]